jgi:hypothetical protein
MTHQSLRNTRSFDKLDTDRDNVVVLVTGADLEPVTSVIRPS